MTLSEMRLMTTMGGERQERELVDEREYAEVLHEHFGIMAPGKKASDAIQQWRAEKGVRRLLLDSHKSSLE